MALSRRAFLTSVPGCLLAAATENESRPHRITLVQVEVTRDVSRNLERAVHAFAQARDERAEWIFFPEAFLSGYYSGFRQDQVEPAFERIRQLCQESRIVGLISTGWKENGKTYNQIRVVGQDGNVVSIYSKTCLTYGESKSYTAGGFPMIHSVKGLRFGTLICNDMWVTPGYSDGPDPRLSLQLTRAGAQVIYHAVNSGNDQNFRMYHESNLLVRAAEAKCSFVIVNAYQGPLINVTSGVVGSNFEYLVSLPRDREVVQTVQFTPKAIAQKG